MRNYVNERTTLAGYIFISPWLFGFLAFMLVPVIMSLYYSFTSYNLVSSSVFVGLENYKEIIMDDPRFLNSLKVTFIYTFTALPLRLGFALLLAVLFNQGRRFVGLYRTLFYVPSLIGGSVAISVVWRQLFGYSGAMNDILVGLGILKAPIGFIGNPKTSL